MTNGSDMFDKALTVGIAGLLIWKAGPALATAATAGSLFCAGRWIGKRIKG